MSPVERARRALSDAGYAVYRPGEALGPCRAAYLVVFDGGTAGAAGGGVKRAVGVMACAPLGQPAALFGMLTGAAAALAPLGMKPRGAAGPENVDEAFRAHTQTIEFVALCAM